MQITALRLATQERRKLEDFYTQSMGFPLVASTETSFTVQVGTTQITFYEREEKEILYHFAFNITPDSWEEAVKWLQKRVDIIHSPEGESSFYSEQINSSMIYFYDPAGNIVELIARYELPSQERHPFRLTDILNVSEIGIVVEDVEAEVARLREQFQLEIYCGALSPTFAMLGDTHGVLIIVKKDRTWFPNEVHAATILPLDITINAPRHASIQLTPYPYQITSH